MLLKYHWQSSRDLQNPKLGAVPLDACPHPGQHHRVYVGRANQPMVVSDFDMTSAASFHTTSNSQSQLLELSLTRLVVPSNKTGHLAKQAFVGHASAAVTAHVICGVGQFCHIQTQQAQDATKQLLR